MNTDFGKYPQLEKTALDMMKALPDGVKGFLYIWVSDSQPLRELWRSGDKKGTGGDGKRLLGICCKRQRSVLVHDAEKDTHMKGIMYRSFLSALCVPIFDQDKSLVGALLLVSDRAETFSTEHKFAMERAARDCGPTLAGMRKVPESPEGEQERTVPGFLFSPIFIGSSLFTLVFFGMWLFSPKASPGPEKVLPNTTQPLVISTQLTDIPEQFLRNLQKGQYEEAWLLLAPGLRSRWASADFNRAMSHWAEQGDNRDILTQRSISKLQRHDRSAKITLLESPVAGDLGPWNWELQEVDGKWGISLLNGPIKPD